MTETKVPPSSIFAIASDTLLACAVYYITLVSRGMGLKLFSPEMVFLLGGTLITGLAVVAGGLYPDLYEKRSAMVMSLMYMLTYVILSLAITV